MYGPNVMMISYRIISLFACLHHRPSFQQGLGTSASHYCVYFFECAYIGIDYVAAAAAVAAVDVVAAAAVAVVVVVIVIIIIIIITLITTIIMPSIQRWLRSWNVEGGWVIISKWITCPYPKVNQAM